MSGAVRNLSDLHPECRGAWQKGLTDYPIKEHIRDCEKCLQRWRRIFTPMLVPK
jgi:hypothetical protein